MNIFFRYVEWICRAEDLVLAEERTTEEDRKLIMDARQRAHEKMKKMSIKSKQDSVETNSMEDGGKRIDLPNDILSSVWENGIFFTTKLIFREINSLVTHSVENSSKIRLRFLRKMDIFFPVKSMQN